MVVPYKVTAPDNVTGTTAPGVGNYSLAVVKVDVVSHGLSQNSVSTSVSRVGEVDDMLAEWAFAVSPWVAKDDFVIRQHRVINGEPGRACIQTEFHMLICGGD